MNYDQARKDFEYLETLAELYDQVELDAQRLDLMQNPTKARACQMYKAAIGLWFTEHGSNLTTHSGVRAIKEYYGYANRRD